MHELAELLVQRLVHRVTPSPCKTTASRPMVAWRISPEGTRDLG
jgi:hypothetical protein